MNASRNLVLVAALAAGLGGCVQTQPHLGGDFGYALHAAVVAQIANPEAVYTGDPAPGSNGARAAAAQERYRTGKVIQPSGIASSISTAEAVGTNGK